MVVIKNIAKITCYMFLIAVIATVFFSFKPKISVYNPFVLNDSVKKDSVIISNDSVFKLLNSETIASYYAEKFIGRRTASGAKYDANAMTCAHKKLKFGTKLKVTNLRNNKSIIVTVNDRGPFVKNRTVDLSEKAFVTIAKTTNAGVVRVKVEQLIEILPKKIKTNNIEKELIIN
jgi:rare lipoprotein A